MCANYFSRDVNLEIINYLNSENESIRLLWMLKIKKKYYTSKRYCVIKNISKVKYKIDKILINKKVELSMIGSKIKAIEFDYYFNEVVDQCKECIDPKHVAQHICTILPAHITHLTFGLHFNQPVNNLPNKITHLTFGEQFNKCSDKLPESVTHLVFGHYFNQSVNNLPKNLTHLTFENLFNQPVNNLPKNLTHLTFGRDFNQPVDKLPNSMTHLTFGDIFNQEVNNLPKALIYLTFGDDFDQKVDKLPQKITHLTFGDDFNQKLDNLPLNIEYISFGNYFNTTVRLEKYKKLREIIIFQPYQQYLLKNIPNNCIVKFANGDLVKISNCPCHCRIS